MNPVFKNLDKIEFPVTYMCTGRCRHCSLGDKIGTPGSIDPEDAERVIKRISSAYDIKTVMAFGGEPLLFPKTVFRIFSAAAESGIEKRVIITNGYFSNDPDVIENTARKLVERGCIRILLSADAFHRERIPLDRVMIFAKSVLKLLPGGIKVHPAWISGRGADNPYDAETSRIVSEFESMGIAASKGNIIFPEGNAEKYLSEYFDPAKAYVNPYIENPEDIRTVSVDPDGSFFGRNIYQTDVLEILDSYEV